ADRPRHLDRVREPAEPGAPGRGRRAPRQSVRHHPGQSGEASAREEGAGPAVHRLGGLGRGPAGDRRLQAERPAAVLPQREERPELSSACARWGPPVRAAPPGGARPGRIEEPIMGWLRCVLPILVALTMWRPAMAAEPVKLYAAGSLKAALTDVAKAYEEAFGVPVATEFAASGLLRERIEGGEAVDVFASANMVHPSALMAKEWGGP